MTDSSIIDTTVESDSQALVVRQVQAVAPGLFGAEEPVAVIAKAEAVARALKDVIVKQGLVSKIQGKEYPRCEAWTLLGTMLGVFPVLCWSKPVDGGWEARVEAKTKDGSIIGAAEAQCLKSERNWSNRDDFALRSMAQTRATAKCLRMPLGFVMSLTGFQVTPAEEMVENHAPPPRTAPLRPASAPAPAKPAPARVPFPTAESRKKMIDALQANPGEPNRAICTEYFQKLTDPATIMPNQELEELELRFVPATTGQMKALAEKLAEFGNGGMAAHAFPPHPEPEPAKAAPAAKKPAAPAEGELQVVGTIERITEKGGTSKKGPWKLYGFKLGDSWYNSFSDSLAAEAKALEGREVRLFFEAGEKGNTATRIEEAVEEVMP